MSPFETITTDYSLILMTLELIGVVKVMPNADVMNGKGIIKLVLNPVMKDGQWYLTLRDNDAEGIEHEDEIR